VNISVTMGLMLTKFWLGNSLIKMKLAEQRAIVKRFLKHKKQYSPSFIHKSFIIQSRTDIFGVVNRPRGLQHRKYPGIQV
jgi:hypothetical protein